MKIKSETPSWHQPQITTNYDLYPRRLLYESSQLKK